MKTQTFVESYFAHTRNGSATISFDAKTCRWSVIFAHGDKMVSKDGMRLYDLLLDTASAMDAAISPIKQPPPPIPKAVRRGGGD